MTNIELGWVAGFLEGEGSFVSRPNGTMRITASSTDEDVIRKLQALVGGKVYKPSKRKDNWKQPWIWNLIKGYEVIQLATSLLPYMGIRRSTRIIDALVKHKEWVNKCNKKTMAIRERNSAIRQYVSEHPDEPRDSVALKFKVNRTTIYNAVSRRKEKRRLIGKQYNED